MLPPQFLQALYNLGLEFWLPLPLLGLGFWVGGSLLTDAMLSQPSQPRLQLQLSTLTPPTPLPPHPWPNLSPRADVTANPDANPDQSAAVCWDPVAC